MVFSKNVEITLRTIFATMTAINICGNLLICVVVRRFTSMRTPMNYLIVHLAICDMLVGVFFLPRRVLWPESYDHPSGVLGDVLCKTLTWVNLAFLSSCASILTMVAIAWERYNAIVHPLQLRFTKKNIRCMIVISWIFGCLLCLLDTWVLVYNPKIKQCDYDWSLLWSWAPKLDAILWQIFGIVPFVIMSVWYSRVIKTLWWPKEPVHFAQRFLVRSRKKITKTLIIVAVLGFFCYNPNLVYYTYTTLKPKSSSPQSNLNTFAPVFYAVSHNLVFLNSTINPFIYALQYAKFRKCVKELFSRKRKSSQVSEYKHHAAMYIKGPVTNNNDQQDMEQKTNSVTKQCTRIQNDQEDTLSGRDNVAMDNNSIETNNNDYIILNKTNCAAEQCAQNQNDQAEIVSGKVNVAMDIDETVLDNDMQDIENKTNCATEQCVQSKNDQAEIVSGKVNVAIHIDETVLNNVMQDMENKTNCATEQCVQSKNDRSEIVSGKVNVAVDIDEIVLNNDMQDMENKTNCATEQCVQSKNDQAEIVSGKVNVAIDIDEIVLNMHDMQDMENKTNCGTEQHVENKNDQAEIVSGKVNVAMDTDEIVLNNDMQDMENKTKCATEQCVQSKNDKAEIVCGRDVAMDISEIVTNNDMQDMDNKTNCTTTQCMRFQNEQTETNA